MDNFLIYYTIIRSRWTSMNGIKNCTYLSVLMLPHFVNLRIFESGIDFETRMDDCMPIGLIFKGNKINNYEGKKWMSLIEDEGNWVILNLLLPQLNDASCIFLRCCWFSRLHGDKFPGDRCGVMSDQTRETCSSNISWSSLSSSNINLALIASANNLLLFDCSTWWNMHYNFKMNSVIILETDYTTFKIFFIKKFTSKSFLFSSSILSCSFFTASNLGIRTLRNSSEERVWDLTSTRCVRGMTCWQINFFVTLLYKKCQL